MGDLLATPPPTHLVYIPVVLLVGMVLGFILGRKAGIKEGAAEFMGGGDDDLI